MNKTVGLIKDAVLAPCLGTTKFFYKADILKQPKLGLRRRLMHIAYEGAISQAAQLGRVVAGLARHEAWSQAAHAELRAEQGRAATALEALGQRVEFGLQQYAGAVDAATAGASSAFLTYRDEFRALARRIFKDELAPLQGYANLLFQAYWARAAAEPRTLDRLLETFASVHRCAASARRAAPESAALESPRRLKLLYVTFMCPSVLHGGGLRIFDLLSELAKRHDVDLYCAYRPDLDETSLSLLRSKLGAIRGVSEELFGPADLRAWLQRLGREPGHYDFAEFAYPSAGPTVRDARWVAKRTGFCLVECVTRSKAMDLLRMVEAGRLDGLGECVAQLLEVCHLETAGMADADRVFAVTAKDQQFADTLGAHGRSHVIPTGLSEFAVLRNVKPAATRVGPAALDPLVAFIGYFDHTPNREGMEWYLEYVHPRVRAAVPDYRVRIIGRGNIAFLDKFRAEDASIHATGEVDDIVRPLRDVRVCISPLISGAGIRGKINQYAAAGRPTVTTSIGVCGTPYEHDVSVLVADAPDTFADAIVSLLRDDARWLKLREGAGKVVRAHFMWPAITQRVESLYAR